MKQSLPLSNILHPASPTWSARLAVSPTCLDHFWRSWLLGNGSLTARLSALAPGEFSVDCQAEGYGRPSPIERKELNLGPNEPVWFREVTLKLRGTPVVSARTAVPVSALKGEMSRLQHLGNRSLGSFLFRQPSLQRGPIKVSHCKANHLGVTWCRRSVFRIKHHSLMVSEAFNPNLCLFV